MPCKSSFLWWYSSKSMGLLQHSLLPWMVSFQGDSAMNVLLGTCCALLAVVTAVTWIGSLYSQKIWKLALPGLLITRSHTSGLGTCIWQNMHEHANQHVLNHLFSGVMAKIRFFVEACYKVAFKVRLGTPPAFVVLGVVAWLPMQGRWFIHPRYFFKFADVRYSYFWYMICYSDEFDVSLATHSVTSVIALRAPHGPVVSHWYSCISFQDHLLIHLIYLVVILGQLRFQPISLKALLQHFALHMFSL